MAAVARAFVVRATRSTRPGSSPYREWVIGHLLQAPHLIWSAARAVLPLPPKVMAAPRASAKLSSVEDTGVGTLLRRWRTVRRLSQLDLSLEAEVSARH